MRLVSWGDTRPITADQLRAAVHLGEEEDAALDLLIDAAIDVVETATNRALAERVVAVTLPPVLPPQAPWRRFWLPILPVVALIDPPAGVQLLTGHEEPILQLAPGATAPQEILARVGYGPGAMPPALRQAVILLAKEWHDAQIAVDQLVAAQLSFGLHRLLRQQRYRRPLVAC